MSDFITATILGIVEGITEFLPVSSTGHLLITEKLIPQWAPHQSDLFNVVIQSGAVLAVIPLFKDRLLKITTGWRGKSTQDFIFKLLAAFLITCAGGFALDHMRCKLPETIHPIAWALLIGGVLFLAVEKWIKNKPLTDNLTWTVAIATGLAQLLAAILPGTSRSGSTILFALILGVSRPAATEFSFLVGIPTMLAAGGWKILKTLHHPEAGAPPENWSLLLLTTLISGIVAFIAVKWLLRYVQSHTFKLFGWYRIAVGATLLIASLFLEQFK
jgi:undecaprenyl-diphosphatase